MNKQLGRLIAQKITLLFATALICLSTVAFLSANEPLADSVKFNDWKIVGPDGGDVRVVTIDPKDKNRLYVSTLDGQIHTSADGGSTWKLLVNFNRPQLVLDQLIVDARDSNVIYASGHRHKLPGGFFKTKDGGATWKEAEELSKESIHAMVQSSVDPNMLLVGTVHGIWMSKNAGDEWTKISSDTMPINIGSLAIDPRTNDTIYAGTWWRAYKSTDAGKSWRLIKDGMIDDSDVFAVTINKENPNHIVASACSGIYESRNAGEKWAKIQGIPSQSRRTRDIVQHPSRPGTIYAATTEGFWMTSDGGKTWAMTSQRNLEINSISVHPDNPDRVFIGTNNYGVMVSNDGGRSFKQTNDNFSSRFTYTITPDIENSNRLYATTQNTATGGGFVFISNDNGTTWQQAKNLDIMRVSPYAFLQDRANPNTLYLGTNVGMFRSIDRGLNWAQLLPPKKAAVKKTAKNSAAKAKAAVKKTTVPAATEIGALIPALGEKIKILQRTEDGKNGILAGTDKGIYRSYDLTKGWEKISFGPDINESLFAITISAKQPETMWVGTARSGVIVSHDNGKTWQKVPGVPEDVPISSITIDPNDSERMYVGTAHTFYLTRDAGKTWQRRGGNLPIGNYTSILINPDNSKELFVSSALESDGGVFFSNNYGQTWKRLDTKEMKLASRRVWTLAFDPNDSNRIFAGTHSSGVYRIERTVKSTRAEATPADNLTRPRVSAETGN
jgi:photosystem II stability/assembly factor-like uncharacterized protein